MGEELRKKSMNNKFNGIINKYVPEPFNRERVCTYYKDQTGRYIYCGDEIKYYYDIPPGPGNDYCGDLGVADGVVKYRDEMKIEDGIAYLTGRTEYYISFEEWSDLLLLDHVDSDQLLVVKK